ncbi:MAG: HemK2/MTQ2 family protein methyltransferase [Nanobdellota archaeon]
MTEHPVYEVDDDTLLLLDTLNEELDKRTSDIADGQSIRVLDMGAGSGHLGFEAFKRKGVNVTLADNNKNAIEQMQLIVEEEDLNIQVIETDLFESIPSQRFDIIVFNTPYLPYDVENDVYDPSVHGGVKGNEVTLRFLENTKQYLAEGGCILLLFSSLSTPEEIHETIEHRGFQQELVNEKKLFFETLHVYKLTR